MKTIDAVIEQCEEIANVSKQHTLHMTHFSQSYDEWAEEWTQIAEWLKELKAYREIWSKLGMWLADTRLAIAPDEFLNDVDEELVRVAQVDMIDTVLEWMDKQEVKE